MVAIFKKIQLYNKKKREKQINKEDKASLEIGIMWETLGKNVEHTDA